MCGRARGARPGRREASRTRAGEGRETPGEDPARRRSALELRFREQFEGDMEKADQKIREQMVAEQKKIAELKVAIERLLDDISLQENARFEESRARRGRSPTRAEGPSARYIQRRSRTADARRAYEEGVNKRIGGVANDGRYAASQSIKLGNSFSGLINSRDDVTSKIYENAQGEAEVAPKKKSLFGIGLGK